MRCLTTCCANAMAQGDIYDFLTIDINRSVYLKNDFEIKKNLGCVFTKELTTCHLNNECL